MTRQPASDDPHLALRPEALDWVDVEGEIVALDRAGSIYLGLNREGVLLWRMLAKGATRTALEGSLVSEHGISPERAVRDVASFLERLAELGLLARPDE